MTRIQQIFPDRKPFLPDQNKIFQDHLVFNQDRIAQKPAVADQISPAEKAELETEINTLIKNLNLLSPKAQDLVKRYQADSNVLNDPEFRSNFSDAYDRSVEVIDAVDTAKDLANKYFDSMLPEDQALVKPFKDKHDNFKRSSPEVQALLKISGGDTRVELADNRTHETLEVREKTDRLANYYFGILSREDQAFVLSLKDNKETIFGGTDLAEKIKSISKSYEWAVDSAKYYATYYSDYFSPEEQAVLLPFKGDNKNSDKLTVKDTEFKSKISAISFKLYNILQIERAHKNLKVLQEHLQSLPLEERKLLDRYKANQKIVNDYGFQLDIDNAVYRLEQRSKQQPR